MVDLIDLIWDRIHHSSPIHIKNRLKPSQDKIHLTKKRIYSSYLFYTRICKNLFLHLYFKLMNFSLEISLALICSRHQSCDEKIRNFRGNIIFPHFNVRSCYLKKGDVHTFIQKNVG